MRKTAILILVVYFLMCVTITADIPVMRQILVFICLSFVPGFVLLQVLRLSETDLVDTVLFSVGLSITFLMFVGLLVNELFPVLGIPKPLTSMPLIITISILTLGIFLAWYRQNSLGALDSVRWHRIRLANVLRSLLLLILPILSIIGALYVNAVILSLMVVIIAILYVLSAFSKRFVPVELYPIMIFAIGIALTFQFSFISRHIMGFDAPVEYYVFRLTQIGGHWRPLAIGTDRMATVNYSTMLSVTILPTTYSVLMKIDGEILFKVFYPFVFSLVPLTLYRIYQKQFGTFSALLSALFFISTNGVFYGVEPLSLNKQIIGTFFLVLSILLLLNKQVVIEKRRLLLFVFGSALVVSHYSLLYIYLSFVVVIYVVSRIKSDPNRTLNWVLILSLFAMTSAWYTLVSSSPLLTLVNMVNLILSRFKTDFYNPAARSSAIFSPQPISTIASVINWILFIGAHFFIVIGILLSVTKAKQIGIDLKYRTALILSTILLFLGLTIPNFAPALNFSRLYAITMLFLAPCFVLGSKTFLNLIKNVRRMVQKQRYIRTTHIRVEMLLTAILLSAYFLSQSGFINKVAGTPLSFSLDFERMINSKDYRVKISFYNAYIPEEDVLSAIWLCEMMGNTSVVYADFVSIDHALYVYGSIPAEKLEILFNSTNPSNDSYIYLRRFNVEDNLITSTPDMVWNMTEISSLLNRIDKIYTNGNSEIYGRRKAEN